MVVVGGCSGEKGDCSCWLTQLPLSSKANGGSSYLLVVSALSLGS